MKHWNWLLVAVAVLSAGCGGDGLNRVPIQGELVADGKPVASATVQFFPSDGTPGLGAIGLTNAEGKFEVISSRNDDEGIPPGKYRVRVSRMINPDGTPVPAEGTQADFPLAIDSVPAPYSGQDSPLEVTISQQGGTVRVELPVKLLGKS